MGTKARNCRGRRRRAGRTRPPSGAAASRSPCAGQILLPRVRLRPSPLPILVAGRRRCNKNLSQGAAATSRFARRSRRQRRTILRWRRRIPLGLAPAHASTGRLPSSRPPSPCARVGPGLFVPGGEDNLGAKACARWHTCSLCEKYHGVAACALGWASAHGGPTPTGLDGRNYAAWDRVIRTLLRGRVEI